ncbi:MAG: cell division protein FtsA [Candidatus Nealsonbacteria bacterium]|nr:cell division protein FtsA [Candidatus Nealsonbacteria bacterium]
MQKANLITALDIGTSSIKGVCLLKNGKSNSLELAASAQHPSFGVRRGVVVRVEEVSKIINNILEQLENQSGQKIESVFVNIGGSHIFTMNSSGSVVVSRADQRISQEDVDRVVQAAQTFSLPFNKEILDIYPKEFTVDGEKGIKGSPLGMQGLKLEAQVLAIGAFSPYFKNSTSAVLNSGLQILDIIPSPVATARAVLSPQQKELGTCVIDIGAGTTDVAIYKEGDLMGAAVLPIGSDHITHDIAVWLKTDIEAAERIKIEFGTCDQSSSKKEKIKVSGEDNNLVFSRKMLSGIIVARITDIFSEVQKEIKNNFQGEILPGGIVLTGGGSKLPKIVELCKKELKLPCRLGFQQYVREAEKDSSLSCAYGLALWGFDSQDGLDRSDLTTFGKEVWNRSKNFFRNFIP